jgi:hypothetical protein
LWWRGQVLGYHGDESPAQSWITLAFKNPDIEAAFLLHGALSKQRRLRSLLISILAVLLIVWLPDPLVRSGAYRDYTFTLCGYIAMLLYLVV